MSLTVPILHLFCLNHGSRYAICQVKIRGNGWLGSLDEVQYRMHPVIREWPSQQFYDGKLQEGGGCAGKFFKRSAV